jgi:hypothetical protein
MFGKKRVFSSLGGGCVLSLTIRSLRYNKKQASVVKMQNAK